MTSDQSGALTWGVKESFLGYVRGTGGVVEGSAASDPAGPFVFPVTDASGWDAAAGAGTLKFGAEVSFNAHGGMMALTLADPWIETDENGAWISAVDHVYLPDRSRRLRVAHIKLGDPSTADGVTTWSDIPAVVTMEGAMMFGSVYQPGTPLDALTFSVAG